MFMIANCSDNIITVVVVYVTNSCMFGCDLCACIFQRSFSADVSPAMQTMMTNMAVQQLRMIVPLIRLSDDDVQQYVIFRSAATDSVSSDNSFISASDAVVDGAEGGIDDDEVYSLVAVLHENCDIHSASTVAQLQNRDPLHNLVEIHICVMKILIHQFIV